MNSSGDTFKIGIPARNSFKITLGNLAGIPAKIFTAVLYFSSINLFGTSFAIPLGQSSHLRILDGHPQGIPVVVSF